MMAARLATLLVTLALAAGPVAAGTLRGSVLAIPELSPGRVPSLELAQRTIDRSWGLSEDSIYTEVDIPGWKSEGLAAAMSLVVPGSGQAYVGEGSWIYFALAEVAGLSAKVYYDNKADDSMGQAEAYAGVPADTGSAWSYARWRQATNGDLGEIATLYREDREAYYSRIANDPQYAPGWKSPATGTQQVYLSSYNSAQHYETNSRWATTFLWVNHVLAAFDALRAARNRNLVLASNTRLKVSTDWKGGGPSVVARVETKF